MSRAFRLLLLEGLRKFAETGYTSESDLQEWLGRLQHMLESELPTDGESRAILAKTLDAIYKREVNGIEKRIPGIDRYTLDRVAPNLRAELDKRIFAGVDLIRLNRKTAIEKTLQRFSGWISSIPPAGLAEPQITEAARDITKSITQLKFERRRVAIDQGHKLSAAVAHVVAMGNGAIAGIWHDRGERDHGYDARPVHLKRSGSFFLVRDSWAMKEGLIRKGSTQYSDDIEQPAELPFCSCYYEYVIDPHDLPSELLTGRGRAWVAGKQVYEIRTDSVPSVAQIHAGNYLKQHIKFAGLDISIETSVGSIRHGVGNDGKLWSVTMPADYGYIRRTVGADDEHIDCFVGPNPEARWVWIFSQHDPETREFDEQKVMLGFNGLTQAQQAYEHGFSDGKGRLRIGAVIELTIDQFKAQLAEGRTLLRAV